MTYGFQLFNDFGNNILDSNEPQYTFTYKALPRRQSAPWDWDIELSPDGLVTLDWPNVPSNPHTSGSRAYGLSVVVTRLSPTRVQVTSGGMGGLNNSDVKLWAIDKVPVKRAGEYGLEVFSHDGVPVLTSATPLAKIREFGTVRVGVNTKIEGDPSQVLLFTHANDFYYRTYGLLGPWYMEHNIYMNTGIDPQNRFSLSRIERTRYENPTGYGYEVVPADISYMLIDKPNN